MARIKEWRILRERLDYGRRRQEFVWYTGVLGDTEYVKFRTEAEANAAAGLYNVRRDGWQYVAFGIVGP